ncbi:MAG: hypothetical protein OEV30_03095 [Ignavibacteria bacterium]|nr:hypothetical protein [Ignavibacteria bacterium]
MKRCLVPLLTLFFLAPAFADDERSATDLCGGAGSTQFDFWLGEWTATWTDANGNEVQGANSVTRVLNGCVVYESFKAPSLGFEGWSVSVFDSASGSWKQTWVDNSGGYLDFNGSFMDGMMDFRREAFNNGTRFLQRMLWHNIESDEFDWNWERSDDGGSTWTPLWQIHYSRTR